MIGIIFATLTISTGYYYISPYVTEVFGVSALLGAVLSSSSQYIRPFASFGAGVLGDRINNSKVMLIGQIGLTIALIILLVTPASLGIIPILIACLMIFFCMYMCIAMHFAIMDEEYFPPECVGTAIGLICAIGYLPEATSLFVAGVILIPRCGRIPAVLCVPVRGYHHRFAADAHLAAADKGQEGGNP